MKIKKLISALCLAAGLAFAAPGLASTVGMPGSIAATVQAADGWQKDETGYYYMKDNARVTGLQTINGSKYYFGGDGYRITGSVTIGKKTYYFSPGNGKLCTGYSGLVQIGKNTGIYYSFSSKKNGTLNTSKWIKHNGYYYYADETGLVKLGTIVVKNKLYHITAATGRMTSYGRSSYDKKYYYAAKNGVLQTGLKTINGKLYYFDPATGVRKTGTVKVGSSTYYFSASSGYARKGWVHIGKKYYYYGSNYKRLTGVRKIGGKIYYLDPADNGARVAGKWKKIGKYYYYYNAKGVLQTGFIDVGGKRYYSNYYGVRQTGWKTLGGRKYYFNSSGVMQTGWLTYNKNKYYLNPSKTAASYGSACVGFVRINGSWYYFNTDGTMKTGWLVENNKKYFFGITTGKMLTGVHVLYGQTYDFGTRGYISLNPSDLPGEWRVEVNRKKCFVVVYKGNTEVKAFVCSTARDGVSTPTGTFSIMDKLYWHELMGPSWGQYCSHITPSILFHSVPNTRYNDPYSLETWEYNKLGFPASAGCIRLSVRHAKWLFENVPVGTKVIVSDSVAAPKTVSIEWPPRQAADKYYDPTDTFANPYSVR